ncbi:hypothetical protein QQS21_005706 [Conoideocrella luteorostrata]|uniref:Protein kinase domain-containing protein n=1 Tax=Conoideocrella luteorostrata TaxID=1105319 RepID=A0AAJ0CT78_9HYPO|nr:hypothetical protein QQS21_005706 [Conoideocrella luteorostrata]
MDLESESGPWKYLPFERGEFVRELGFDGFSTVRLAQNTLTNLRVALKVIAARESPTHEARSVIASHPSIAQSRLFAVVDQQFWVNGPSGRHLCLDLPVLGPNMSKLSKGIYSRLKPAFAKAVSFQVVRALAHLHSNGLCHGDILKTATVGPPPENPHAPSYIVVPLDFCSSTTNGLGREICVIDFGQSFTEADDVRRGGDAT